MVQNWGKVGGKAMLLKAAKPPEEELPEEETISK